MLEIEAPGYELLRKSITADAGHDLAVEIELTPVGEPQERHRWLRNPWVWAGVSVLVAGMVVGGLALAGRFDEKSSNDGGNGPLVQLLSRSSQ